MRKQAGTCMGRKSVPLLELDPTIDDGREAVGGQAAFRGAHGQIEFDGDFGNELMPVDGQVKALVGQGNRVKEYATNR